MICIKVARMRRWVLPGVVAFLVTGLPHASAVPVVAPQQAWTHQFGGVLRDEAHAVAATSGGIYVAGDTHAVLPGQSSAGDVDAFVRKYGPIGDVVWTRQFGSPSQDFARAVAATPSGIYVAGFTRGVLPGQSSAGDDDAFVRKYDVDGNVVWTRQFGSAEFDIVAGVAATPAGIYVAGYAESVLPGESSAGAGDAFVRKYDVDGNVVWTRQFGSASEDFASGVAATSGGIYVAGDTRGVLPGESSAGAEDAFVRKYDIDGNVVWTRQFGRRSYDSATGVRASPAGIYVAGYTSRTLPGQTSAGYRDAFVRRYDAVGNIVWTRQFGSAGSDTAHAVTATPTGIYVTGYTSGVFRGQSSPGGEDAFVRRYVSYRPDALISLSASSGYAGNDTYNSTGERQTRRAEVGRGNKRIFFVRAHNDGDTRDSFKVHGCESSKGFKITYIRGITRTDVVTNAVVDGTYRLPNVAPGKSKALRLVIAVTRNATVGSIKRCAVSITSATRPALEDVVKAKVEARR